ncbi:MAG TPA: endonuclease domain-containing protein [Moheibacter sp.]|nr:endonuclease domain-containing protein [Moheibacter sp.]
MSKKRTNHDEGMFKGAPTGSFLKAKELRGNMTEAELILWEKLKGNQLNNLKFRRQHPIGVYIADFYCHALKLIIEIDGDYHNTIEQKKLDEERTKYLEDFQIKVLRFTNHEILTQVDEVLNEIVKYQNSK